MGFLTDITDAVGLTDSKAGERAAAAAQFNPYNIQTSFGGVDYDRANRLFTTSLDPQLVGLRNRYTSELGGVSPANQLSLFRQQAAPFNEQMLLRNENRLFSQGRMDFSPEYQEFGQTRGLYDAILNQDFGFQLQAAQEADRRRAALLGQIGGIQGMEMGLFSPAQQMGALGASGQQMGAQLQMQGAMNTQNFFGSLLGGGLMGFGAGGGFNKLFD